MERKIWNERYSHVLHATHLTLGCFVASNRMQMRIYELQFFAFSALAVDKCWWCRLYSHAKMDAKIFWTGRGARLVLPHTKYSIRHSLYHRTPILQKATNVLSKSRLYILFDHINTAKRVEYPKKSSF